MDLFKQVLDHTVVDASGLACGCVDDIIADRTDGSGRITSLLIGPGAFVPRLPALLEFLLPHAVSRRTVRVPWSEVAEVGEVIKLKSNAASLGLGKVDRKLGALLARVPGAEKQE